MTTIRLLDARRGLNRKCEELFGNAKIAELIYRYLCDGIEECEDAEPERKKGKWKMQMLPRGVALFYCSECGFGKHTEDNRAYGFCPNCGADMREVSDNG